MLVATPAESDVIWVMLIAERVLQLMESVTDQRLPSGGTQADLIHMSAMYYWKESEGVPDMSGYTLATP